MFLGIRHPAHSHHVFWALSLRTERFGRTIVDGLYPFILRSDSLGQQILQILLRQRVSVLESWDGYSTRV